MGQTLPGAAMTAGPPTAVAGWDSVAPDGLPGTIIRDALSRTLSDRGALATRGAKEIGIYQAAAPSVVLIITFDDKLGSGSYLGDGKILTNWHVVSSSRMVGVLFKPPQDGAALDFDGLVRADVVKSDPAHDLALIKLSMLPKSLKPLELGSPSEIQIGADVHAIGHPTGQAWTYTKGLISQIRDDFKWENKGEHIQHEANLIQTQTPISPGNSGGPLLGDSGRILGVNSFKDLEGENLNFAVSVKDIAAFLAAPAQVASVPPAAKPEPPRLSDAPPPQQVRASPSQDGRAAPSQDGRTTLPRPATKASIPPGCKPRQVYDSSLDPAVKPGADHRVGIDTNCDNIADITIVTPADKSKPILALIDSNYDGRIDIIIEDIDRDGRWDISYHDVDFDGTIDLIGYHPDGSPVPSRYEKYAAK
ncbi:MAG TPA: trypsin-like peptidase domain-containing protein [Xanthobacteraceae bacterium]